MRSNPFKQEGGGQLLNLQKRKCPHCEQTFLQSDNGREIVYDGGMAAHITSEHKEETKKDE